MLILHALSFVSAKKYEGILTTILFTVCMNTIGVLQYLEPPGYATGCNNQNNLVISMVTTLIQGVQHAHK